MLRLRSALILEATDRKPERSIAGDHEGVAAVEDEDARKGAANRTRPVVAEATDIIERPIAVTAEARHGEF